MQLPDFENRLALSDDILMSVEKPARYIGGEINAVIKDKRRVAVRFAMCFPDVYEIGMSHLGIQILYDMFNRYEDVWCERVYSPWVDLDRIMRERKIPLFALESQEPVRNFDFLGITLQYEMCYTNILQVLDLSGIPLLAADRGEDVPIVIGGGPCAYDPEPIAPFFDLFYIGEGETAYRQLLDLYKENRRQAADGRRFCSGPRGRCPASMCLPSMPSPITRTGPSLPSSPRGRVSRQSSARKWSWIWTMFLIPPNRWSPISR